MNSSKMRGGKRPGAGRPPNFTLFEKLQIHGRCKIISQEMAVEDAKNRMNKRFEGDEIDDGLEVLHQLTLKERRQVIALLDARRDPPDDAPDRIKDAYSEMAFRREALDRKGRGIRGTSYGAREAILKKAAEWATGKFGRDVSVNQVEEILKDRQGDLKRVLSYDDDSPGGPR